MYQELTVYDIVNQFRALGRLKNANGGGNFSTAGLTALVEYLEELENETAPIEFDVIAICCQFSEYDSALDAVKDIHSEAAKDIQSDFENEMQAENTCTEWLEERTVVIPFENGVLIDSEF